VQMHSNNITMASKAELFRADAAEKDVVFAFEVARRVQIAIRESGRRMKLDGRWWDNVSSSGPLLLASNHGIGGCEAKGGGGGGGSGAALL